MIKPNVENVFIDETTGAKFTVMAYRQLSVAEGLQAINFSLSKTPKSKWPKRGDSIKIITVIGCR